MLQPELISPLPTDAQYRSNPISVLHLLTIIRPCGPIADMGRPVYRVDTRCQFARPDSRFACLQVIESTGRFFGRGPASMSGECQRLSAACLSRCLREYGRVAGRTSDRVIRKPCSHHGGLVEDIAQVHDDSSTHGAA